MRPLAPGGCGEPVGARTVFYRDRRLGARQFARIQRLLDARPGLTREALAHEVARRFDWRSTRGEVAVSSCRLLLGRLARRGLIHWPVPPRAAPAAPRRAARERAAAERGGAEAPQPAPLGLDVTAPLRVDPIGPAEGPAWQQRMARHHYLGAPRLVGPALRYTAWLGATPVALLAWGAAALHNPPRDRYLGWDAATRAGRLPLIVNNSRFLMLPGIAVPHLASRILAATLRRLRRDWQARFGPPVLLAETFVDSRRFRGTSYRASNWRYLGDTRGFARRGPTYHAHGQPKAVWVYPLHPRAVEWLQAPVAPAPPLPTEVPPMVPLHVSRLPLAGQGGLIDVLRGLTDPRKPRGVRHSVVSIMAIAVCATLAGAQSLVAIAHWAQDQSPRTLRRLWCRGRVPSEATIRRVLMKLDVQALDARVGAWLAQQTMLAGQGLAIDGKTLRGSAYGDTKAVHLVSAVLHGDGVVVAQHRVPDKTNEMKSVEPLFADRDITGAVVTGDAMFAQKAIATHLVEDKHADYLFTVKDNQPTVRQDIVDLQLDATPPSAHHGR